MKKIENYLPFLAVFLLPLMFYPAIDTSGWRSSSDVHAFFEFASSLLAITAGVMVLLHFFTTGRWFFLIISIGFVQIGAEHFVHAIFSFNRIWSEIPPTFKFAISTTWLTGHFMLLASLFVALIIGERQIVPGKRRSHAVAYNAIGLVCAACVALVIFNAPFLPDFVQLGSITKKFSELSLSLLYFAAFLFYSNIYFKQQSRSPLLWSISACIILRVLVHIFVFNSQAFYDSHWDTAHLIVFLSYFFPIFGVWGETIKLHKLAEVQVIELVKEMTERKRAEEALARLSAQLEVKNKELEQVVYVASHDLRSPLVNIDGYGREVEYAIEELNSVLAADHVSNEALKAAAGSPVQEMSAALRYIRSSTTQMDALLTGLLKLSRSGRAALTIVPLNMNELISGVVAAMEFQIKEAGVELRVAELPPCRGDAVQVRQVFTNLLSNALKYLDPARPGVIRISGVIEGERSVYSVADNGIGIAPGHQENIFEVFHRLEPSKSEGEGLGLTIVRQVIGRLEGEVRVESKPGEGSRFIVALPTARGGEK